MEHPHREIATLQLRNAAPFEGWATRRRSADGREFAFCAGLTADVQRQARILNARAHVYRTPEMSDDELPRVGIFMEQAPNPDSRVLLAESRDPLGVRRLRLDWRLTDLDWRTYQKTAEEITEAFVRAGAGHPSGPVETNTQDRVRLLHSNHHLGTTRMSSSPADGVVDADCRVHGVDNLYIVGGSVFPTVSWANPTFTVMALTLRLATHLRARLEGAA
jgi:choline dehydrogenase-like flavoprotein